MQPNYLFSNLNFFENFENGACWEIKCEIARVNATQYSVGNTRRDAHVHIHMYIHVVHVRLPTLPHCMHGQKALNVHLHGHGHMYVSSPSAWKAKADHCMSQNFDFDFQNSVSISVLKNFLNCQVNCVARPISVLACIRMGRFGSLEFRKYSSKMKMNRIWRLRGNSKGAENF